MKRALVGLMLAAFAAMGCESLPRLWGHQQPTAPTATAAPAAKRPLVTADEVNDSNARQVAEALLDEMDRDAQGELPPAVEPPAKSSADKRP